MINKFLYSHSSVVHTVYRIYQYNDSNYRIACLKFYKEPGFEFANDDFISIDDELDSFYCKDSDSFRCSRSRSRRKIREYALCNNFEYFVTITVNSEKCDRFSLTECQELLRSKLHSLKHMNKDFAYLLITECHKNGAFHFHGLVKGINDNDLVLYREQDFEKLPKYIFTNIRKGEKIYYSKYFSKKIGYCTFSKIKSLSRVSSYITKYITKDCIVNENGYMYICSRGLKSPSISDIKPILLDKIPCFKRSYNYCSTYDIDFNTLDLSQKLYIINNLQDESLKDKLLKLFNLI